MSFFKELFGSAPPNPLEDQKSRAEIAKFNAETTKAQSEADKAAAEAEDVRRPAFKRYQFWVALTPVLTAFATAIVVVLIANRLVWFESYDFKIEAQRAEVNAQRTLLTWEVGKLQDQTNEIARTRADLERTNATLRAERDGLERTNALLRAEAAEIYGHLKKHAELGHDLQYATNYLRTLLAAEKTNAVWVLAGAPTNMPVAFSNALFRGLPNVGELKAEPFDLEAAYQIINNARRKTFQQPH